MKKNLLFTFFMFISTMLFAGDLVLIHVDNHKTLQQLFEKSELTIHYYNDQYVIGTLDFTTSSEVQKQISKAENNAIVLDKNAFSETENYFIVYCSKEKQLEYIQRERKNGKVLYQASEFLIVKPLNAQLLPAKNDGMVAVFNTTAFLPKQTRDYPVVTEEDPGIRSMMNEVVADSTLATIQHLQDFGTRMYNSDGALEAKDWIVAQYEALGLEVSTQNFSIYGSPSSPNVIAVQQGTLYPDEYVVCGSHYDSFTWEAYYGSGTAPGADDNASGCAGIIETARILSQYQFERSIIYCAFSGEELGLYGSAAYATSCQNQGMNIVGYFNLDMTGYLQEGDPIHIDLIYPQSASQLADFYLNVCEIYFPEMDAAYAYLSGGDSDHTSFNNHGYQGIFPFEDVNHESPYIHTENDLIGPSVNNIEQVKRFTEVNLAAVATLAFPVGSSDPCNPVTLSAVLQEGNAVLTWDEIENAISYSVYYNEAVLATDITETTFTHENIPEGNNCYTVKTICPDGESDFSNEACVENLSIDELENNVQIYPNPANQQFSIFGTELVGIQIFNTLGQCVQTETATDSRCVVNTSDFLSGVYMVRIISKDHTTMVKHVIVLH